MGKLKTEYSRETKGMLKGQKMAEAFAKHKGPGLFAKFLDDSTLAKDMYQAYLAGKDQISKPLTFEAFVHHLATDYERSFCEGVALAYALGYIDCVQGKSIKDIYVPRNLMPVPTPEEKSEGREDKLILPGIA